MSLGEISVTIRAVNRASTTFDRIKTDAESLETKIESLGSRFAAFGATATAVAHLGRQFGILSDEQSRFLGTLGSVILALGMFLNTSLGVAVAQKVYAAACWIATAAQNAFNISFAAGLALTGVGIGVIIAAAAAVAHFASQMNAATSSVKDYNAAVSETPSYTRSIHRAGESEIPTHSGSSDRDREEELRRRRRGLE